MRSFCEWNALGVSFGIGNMSMRAVVCMCVGSRVRVCMRMCSWARVRVSVRACVRVGARACVSLRAWLCARASLAFSLSLSLPVCARVRVYIYICGRSHLVIIGRGLIHAPLRAPEHKSSTPES